MQTFILFLKTRMVRPFILFILLATSTQLAAEGTNALAPSTADEAALFIGAGNTGFNGGDYGLFAWKDSDSKLYFNIQNTCEKVYIGFSIPLTSRAFTGVEEDLIFRILDPNGMPVNDLSCFGNTTIGTEVWQTLNSTTANISGRSQADNGPTQLGNAGGYTAFELDLSACGLTLTGNYSIEFYTTDLPYDPNTNQSGFYIPYFDITVADCDNTGLTGRVWSNNWGLAIKSDGDGSFDRAFNGRFYVCSNEGFITKIDFNSGTNTRAEAGKNTDQRSGFRAGSFNVSFNTTGTNNTGNILTDRKSLGNINSPAPELPVFLNSPDEALCKDVRLGDFRTAPIFLTGCPTERCINILVSEIGQIEILIEGLNGNGIFDDPSERRLAYAVTANDLVAEPQDSEFPYEVCIPWDGRDGNGNLISQGDFTITGFYSQGIYHFPVYDAEFNDDGFIVETIRPALGPQELFYDDTMIGEANNTGESKDGTNGCITPCHRWTGEWEDYTKKDDVYGNFNTINTWWFANTEAKDLTSSVNKIEPLTIVCPPDVNGCPGASTNTSVTGMATSPDDAIDCPVIINFTDAVVSGACGAQTITRTWTAYFEGLSSQSVACVQIIVLKDMTAPIMPVAPADITKQCIGEVPAANDLTATDNCDGNITVSPVERRTTGSCDNHFIIIRTWTFTDNCGNADSVVQNITINDTTAPIPPTAPEDITDCEGDGPPAGSSLTAIDNCDGEITANPVDELIAETGATLRTWTFTDACGNTSIISQYIAKCVPRVDIPETYCTFTQGYYGNKGGKFDGKTTTQILEEALAQGPVVIGQPGHSLTINSSKCILALLPGGGRSKVLPNGDINVGNNCDPSPVDSKKNGRLSNTVVAQVITLTLNTRFDANLNALPLANICFSVPQSILNDLPANPTVSDLLAYANAVLGGAVNQNVSAINEVVSGINEQFDECADACNLPSQRVSTDDSSDELLIAPVHTKPTFSIAPNPAFFTTTVHLQQFEGQTVRLTVRNKVGQPIYEKTLAVNAETSRETIDVQSFHNDLYFLTVQSDEDGMIYTKKLLVAAKR